MDLTDDTFVEAVWFLAGPNCDFLATVFRVGDGPWQGEHRFRYYNPDSKDPFDKKDRKSSYITKAPDASADSLAKFILAMNVITSMMAKDWKSKVEHISVQGGAEVFAAKLAEQTWAHIKVVPVAKGSQQVN